MEDFQSLRRRLDLLFVVDAVTSVGLGVVSLLAPHRWVATLSGGSYNHGAHEVLRLYACLRIAVGWIVLNLRHVDDGRLRKHVCEALCACYALQACAVLRAQCTEEFSTPLQWLALLLLTALSASYGTFRFRKRGTLIKIYELPTSKSIR
jgi:hypothetical protein